MAFARSRFQYGTTLAVSLSNGRQGRKEAGGFRGSIPVGSSPTGTENGLKLNSNQHLTTFTRVVILTAFYFLHGLLGVRRLFLESGDTGEFQAVTQDITQRKQSQQALRLGKKNIVHLWQSI